MLGKHRRHHVARVGLGKPGSLDPQDTNGLVRALPLVLLVPYGKFREHVTFGYHVTGQLGRKPVAASLLVRPVIE